MTTEQPSAPSGASGRASGRHSLHLLVQQIGEIVAQGEDSGSQQQSQSDGGLRVRLRTVLLALLDGIMGDSAGPPAKEVASMLKLLSITLSRSSTLLSGDNHNILPEVLERLLPLLAIPSLASLHGEAGAVICRILSLLHGTSPGLLESLARGTAALFEDAYDVAGVLSTQPGLTASVACYAGALRSTDSAEPPLQLRLDSPAACECLLAGALRMLAHCLRLRPLKLGAELLSAALLDRCTGLLLSSSQQLQAAGMRFLATALSAAPLVPCSRPQLLDTLSLALQQHSAAAAEQASRVQAATSEQPKQAPADAEEWWQALVLLLRVLHDDAISDSLTTTQLLPRTFSFGTEAALAAAAPAGGASEAWQQALCQLCRDALLVQPSLLEGSTQLLQLFPSVSRPCRQLLLQCVALYLERQQQLCGTEAVRAAFVRALEGTGISAQAMVVAEDEEGSARKRRRLRATPSRPASPPERAPKALLPPPPSLSAVAASVARLAADLQERCGQQGGPDCAAAFAALLGLLGPLAPRPAVALATSAVTAALEAAGGSGSRRQSVNIPAEQLGALLRLTLAALQAGLVESAASKGEVDASTALAQLRGFESQLHSILQRAWQLGSGGGRAEAATEGAALAAAEERQLMSLTAGLAAVQAQLLHPEDLLKLLQQALGQDSHTAEGSGSSSGAHAVAAAAAVLLPAAACIAAHTRDNKDSAPRATQGGRRSRQPTPNPVVTALQQLVGSAGQRPPAVLAATARGLLCAVRHSREALHMETPLLALAAIDAALDGSSTATSCSAGSGAFGVAQLLHTLELSGSDGPPAEFQPSLSAAMSEWVRPTLEHLAAAQLPAEGQVALVDAAAVFLQRGAQGQLEHARPLVQWLVQAAASPLAPVRSAVLRHAALFAEPQVILALCHEGEHPIHTKDREAMVEALEAQMLQALREALEAAAPLGAGSSGRGGSSTGESIREGLVQIIGCVGTRMRSHHAHTLLLGIMITQLDRAPPVRALAAEALLAFADSRKAALRDTLFASSKLVAFLARQLPSNPELLGELAELCDCGQRTLALAILPQALPMLVAEGNMQGMELLAQQAGMPLARLMHDFGHCVVARELFQGSTSFDAYISILEKVTGQDFVLFLYSTMSRTIMEIFSEAGSAEDWGSGVALPETVLRRATVTLENLSHVSRGDQELSVADFLAEGDHVTRMLKDWGDSLDRRLPPLAAHRQAAAAAAGGDGTAHAAQQGQHSAQHAQHSAQMAPADVRACVTVLRCILLLSKLAGRFVGRFLPQLMVLLTAGLRPANPREIKLQCLEGWHGLVRALAAEAPVQLGGIVNQVVVALMESLTEGGAVGAAAIKVVEELVLICKRVHRAKLRTIPPLPNWVKELTALNETLANERGKLAQHEQIELLIDSLGDESMTVRATALRELRSLLSTRREWALGLLGPGSGTTAGDRATRRPVAVERPAGRGGAGTTSNGSGSGGSTTEGPQLLSRLMAALLRCCDPEVHNMVSQQAQQACAECLGMLGAVDPARLQVDPQPPASRCTSDGELLVTLISRHLVRLLKTAPSLQVLDAATLAIQELLKHYSRAEGLEALQQQASGAQGGASGEAKGWGAASGQQREPTPAAAEGNLLFGALPAEVQAIVRPYLDSKYQIRGIVQRPAGTLYTPGTSFRKWLFLWLSQLVQHHASGDQLRLFQSVIPVFRFDVPTSLFLMPYLVHNVLAQGSNAARHGVQQEIEAVLAGASSSREGTLCCQAVFTLLDTLQKWHGDAKAAAQRDEQPAVRGGEAGQPDPLGPQWDCIQQLLDAMPKRLLAQAASRCGAHARSLQYFETHVRTVHGGGLNPSALRSAAYDDAEVSYLQEVYGKLEEPDGLQGLVRLRQGGPRPDDQRLAAEKAGNWSEALTLYEQALQHSSGAGGSGSGSSSSGDLQAAAGMLAGGAAGAGGGAGGAGAVAGGAAGLALLGPGLGSMQRGYMDCLLHIGHLQGLLAQVEGLARSASPMSAAQLAALGAAASWRLGKWDLVEGYVQAADACYAKLDTDARWEVRIAHLLSAVARKDAAALGRDLEAARSEVMGPFSAAAMESYSRAYPHLVKLHMLQEIADVAGCLQRPQGPLERQRALRWEERLRVTQSSLASQEPILALRRQLASLSGAAAEAGECWLQLAQLCRGTGHYEAATTAVLEAVASKVPWAPLEHVQLLWDKGQPYRAVSEAQVLAQQAQEHRLAAPFASEKDHSRFHAQVALQLAQWMAETGQAAKDEITALFDRATSLESKSEAVLFRYAVYLDEVMTDARRRQEAEKERGVHKGLDRLGGLSRIKLGEDKPFLEILPDVIRSYGMSMMYGHAHTSQSLPRMLTLWFDFGTFLQSFRANKAPRHDEKQAVTNTTQQVTAIMGQLAKNVPMHTWLAALPQLISRVCHPCKEVSELAKSIIVRITQAYPHQSLWSLAAVSKSGVAARRAAASSITNAAKKNMDQTMFAEINSFCDQLIRLAAHQPAKGRTMSARKEFNHLMRAMPLSNTIMPAMSCLTVPLPPLPSAGGDHGKGGAQHAQQHELVTIDGIVDTIEVMPSLQKPKKVTLIGSDGLQYIFLAKPKDDLRKDNRMMEAAGVINRLFASDPAARRRNLYLRRFAVLPIGEDNGIVEWVLSTTGLRHCITDMYTASGQWDARSNRVIQKIYEAAPPNKRRSEVLDEVLRLFTPPLLHRWFLGKWGEPAAWLNARLAYTRTTAVWCMVGHIVGLGDRHGENILVDCSSGDVVHVDFSCLFDKGLTLAKPEMVPFRLTQNVIDGFGVSGVEGVYRRCCEITLSVLRQHKGSIISVMDTFVHDPLVDWTRGSSGSRGGGGDEGGDNPQAKDALATIEGRLKGTLLGVSSQPCMPLSVEGQAHRLIEEASNKDNLGMMYIWWMPWS